MKTGLDIQWGLGNMTKDLAADIGDRTQNISAMNETP